MEWEKGSNDQLEEGLGQFLGLVSAGLARVCQWLLEVDRRQQFLADGSPDLIQWLSARYGLAHGTARRLVDTARRLQDLPVLSAAFAEGDLSFDQVEAVSKVATPETELRLVEVVPCLTVAGLERAARRADPPHRSDEMTAHEERYLHIQRTLDGVSGRMNAKLPGAELDVVESAIKVRADRVPVNPETGRFDPYPQRMADGLVELAATSGNDNETPPQITVNAELAALVTETSGVTETGLGSLIPNDTARRLACDSIVECAVYRNNRVVGVGRRTRTVPGWLRRLPQARDGGCRFPGCGRTTWVHAHHILHWSQGGPTDLDNLILLCGWHHRFLHEHIWKITNDQGRFTFHRPDGSAYPPARPELHPRLKALLST